MEIISNLSKVCNGTVVLCKEKDETEYIRHRLILKYDNGCISAEVIDMIIKDFYPNYNKDGNKIF